MTTTSSTTAPDTTESYWQLFGLPSDGSAQAADIRKAFFRLGLFPAARPCPAPALCPSAVLSLCLFIFVWVQPT